MLSGGFSVNTLYCKGNRLLEPGEGVADLGFLSSLEKEVIMELNRARTDPLAYAYQVQDFKKLYIDGFIHIAGQTKIQTKEGVSAVDEAIRFLKTTAPIPALRVSKGLSLAARDHVKDQGPSGKTGHYGTDNSSPGERINRFGTWDVTYGENIDYGSWTARHIVMQLIIDDGVSDRGHRDNIFKPGFKLVGVSYGSHQRYTQMCVMDFAGAYREKSD
ncbi:MAG: CAP domain-containing protein [bacterium]|nr:CAP domain-containing protein [bacterium]